MNIPQLPRRLLTLAVIAVLTASALFVGYRLGSDADTELVQMVDQRIEQKLNAEKFDERVRTVIKAWVADQRRASAAGGSEERDVPGIRPDDHVRGDPDARISLIEYSDYECPYCKRFHGTAMELLERYENEVNWVYRHFPISSHDPAASREAEAAECAAELGGNDAFWALSDAIFERTGSNGRGIDGGLTPLAVDAGLDENAFTECLASGRMTARVQRDLQEGQSAGVRGTPGNFLLDRVTGEIVAISGARPLDQFVAAVDRLLADEAP
jgi:protein-disulfide isomerase